MEGERLGRVVAVALLALPTPVACAAVRGGHTTSVRPPAVLRQRIPRRAAGRRQGGPHRRSVPLLTSGQPGTGRYRSAITPDGTRAKRGSACPFPSGHDVIDHLESINVTALGTGDLET